ncbi:DUF5658 family protein [Crassaminicella profunda]|uniref:DUF5658 family protein n=1 Tax=Crassaminicella profunda TaxID=1286698 RepID=UPI001CA6AEDB|nr:DUF5658 family protein [Crassaminicella profunda]QZY56730.1 DUF5658 family protein [Crassaminicella profunda]
MEFAKEKSRKKVSTNTILNILFLLMIGDYLLTYLGMYTFGVVEEANCLMVWLMELPFWKGFIIRICIALVPILLLKLAERYKDPDIYMSILLVPLSIQFIPYIAHVIWIYKCLKV